ncbi:energy transducer TonB [Parasphingorhabdus halotolerans]|uniref:TonB family protein n=1 Tax=Parasphingorhabdus halotolerans TaxID=2725558 RepID=A0A6H2DP39_9SPHN|nr:energy transducer TonB [Parasphingorhabdus halotolerans]QJB69725.1 TonB family protein [Parasphingorhabdus halotolerans]
MSYTSTYANKPPNAKGIGMTIGVHVIVVAGVMMIPGIELPDRIPTILETFNVPDEKKPDPVIEPLKPEVQIPRESVVKAPKPRVDNLPQAADSSPTPFADVNDGLALGGSGSAIDIPLTPLETITPVPDPVIAEAQLNQRFASSFLPPYPSGELRLGNEGTVSVRVLVDTDGRAKKVQLISSPRPSFWAATESHALKKWRFKPATKDGKPFESWITLKVKFEIKS